MPRVRLKSQRLTDEGIARIRLRRPGEPRLTAWDTETRGLGVRVTTASRTFVLRFTPEGGKQTLVVLGDTEGKGALDVDAARLKARDMRAPGRIAAGKLTVSSLLAWYGANVRTRKKGRTPLESPDTRRRLAMLVARWGTERADAITHEDVAAVLVEITARGAPYEANRTRALVRAIWNEARRLGMVPAAMLNPAEGTPVNRERQRDVRALKAPELVRLLDAAGRYSNPWAAGAVRLLALTGCRAGEVLALRWDDVDLEAGAMVLRDRKGGDTLALPLGAEAIATLRALPRQAGSQWVFPSSSTPGAHLVDLRKPWAAILDAAGLPPTTRIHDVRAAVATNIASTAGLKVAKLVLGHADERTTMRYVRPGAEDIRAAVEAHGRAATGATTPRRARKAGAR